MFLLASSLLGPISGLPGSSGMTSRSRGRNRWQRQPFPPFPLPTSRCQEIRNPASSGRTPAEGAESLEDACCAWRRLHLDPQLRRPRLVSRPFPTPLTSAPDSGRPSSSPRAAPTPQGRPGLRGLGTAPPTGSCRVAAVAAALRLLPRLPRLARVEPERKRREGGARRPARGDAPLGATRREGADCGARRRASGESRGAQGGATELGEVRAGHRGESGRTLSAKVGEQCSGEGPQHGSSFQLTPN